MLLSPTLKAAFAFITTLLPVALAAEPGFYFDPVERGEIHYPQNLKATHDARTLTAFWWNIREGGSLSRRQEKQPLEKNLVNLVRSEDAPEVLVLGEYVPGFFHKDTEFALDLHYPYHSYTPDSSRRKEMGIKVYSLYPFTKNVELLDWSPYRESAEKQARFKQKWRDGLNSDADRVYERPFIDVRVQKDNQLYHVIPVHLLNPWVPLTAQIGRTKAGLVMMFGDDNPHYRQVERLVFEKVRPLLQRARRENSGVVMIGDFNLPDELYGVSPVGFELISLFMDPSVNPLFSDDTFPAISSDMTNQPQLRIDHAFVSHSTHVLNEARIPFSGSDHYPIAVRVEVH